MSINVNVFAMIESYFDLDSEVSGKWPVLYGCASVTFCKVYKLLKNC